jgi:hypothetical protein
VKSGGSAVLQRMRERLDLDFESRAKLDFWISFEVKIEPQILSTAAADIRFYNCHKPKITVFSTG